MTNDYVKNLIESRNAAWEQAKGLLDAVEAEKRDLSAEERAQFDRINADIEAKDAQVQEYLTIQEREAAAAEARSRFENIARTTAEAPAQADSSIADFLRGKTAVREMNIGPETRDLTVGSATAGGDTVPSGFYATLIETLEASTGVLRTNPNIVRTNSGNNIDVPLVSAYTAAELVAEGATPVSETDPTFGQITLGAYKMKGFTQASLELVQDSGVDIEAFIARNLGTQVARKMDSYLATGTGTSQPKGVFSGFSAAVTAASASLTMDNLIALQHSVYDGYRGKGTWLMKDDTLRVVRQLKDNNNQYLWQPSTIAGSPDTLLGRPVVTDAFAPAVGTGNKSVAFGDFYAGFMVRIVKDVQVSVSDQFAFNVDLISWKAVLRVDSNVVDSNAVKLLVHA